jgi:predicted heme/steroid binding protein
MSEAPEQQQRRRVGWHSLRATSTRRALLLTALGGLLIGGVTTALPVGADDPGRLVGFSNAAPSNGGHATQAFDKARPGDCLNWPNKAPDQASIVDCRNDHRFEVAASVDLRMFPGSEYGQNAAAPTASRIQQISQEQCQAAVERYLGAKYDPNSKFTIGMLWSGEKAWTQSGERLMLCGLQLPGAANEQQQVFKGRVADLDQSKVWQAGTCLGIDTTTNQPTDVPIDCAGPHAMEVTGTVNVAEKFPGGMPAEADQDAFIKDSCTRMTDAYLAPVALRATTLTLIYSPVPLPSWSAGSHQVSCSIGATLGNGGWSTLVGSAKGPLLINGQQPIPPPDIPPERLNLPPIPLPTPTTIDASGSQSQGSQWRMLPQQTLSPANSAPTIGTQHLPYAPGPQTVDVPAAPSPDEPAGDQPAGEPPGPASPAPPGEPAPAPQDQPPPPGVPPPPGT